MPPELATKNAPTVIRLRSIVTTLALILSVASPPPAQAIYIGLKECRNFTPRGKESEQTVPLCSDLEEQERKKEEEERRRRDEAERIRMQREEADRNALRADLPFPPSAFDATACRRELRLNPAVQSVCP